MKLTYLSQTYFPFLVPEKDATFASSVGAQTVYPAGYTLEQALQIYWRAKNYRLVAAGNGSAGGVTQALTVNQLLPPRNALVATGGYVTEDGLNTGSIGTLVPGVGLFEVIPGSGTITMSGGTNPDAVFGLQIYLFYPPVFAPDPVVKFAGKWWPAMGVLCSTTNTVTPSTGGERSIGFACDSFDPTSTVVIGSISLFGVSVPISCGALASGETRTFSGSLTVEDEWS